MMYLKKDLVASLSPNGLLAYCALKSVGMDVDTYVSVNMLCYTLLGHIDYTRYFKEDVIAGLTECIDMGLVSVTHYINKNEGIYDLSGLYFEKEFYISVDLDDIRAVLNCPCRVDKCSLLKYFITMVGTFSNKTVNNIVLKDIKGFVGFMPVEFIAEQSGIALKTALSYNTILEDNNIIYIHRHHKCYLDEFGALHKCNNNYGLWRNKKYIKMYAKSYDKYVAEE